MAIQRLPTLRVIHGHGYRPIDWPGKVPWCPTSRNWGYFPDYVRQVYTQGLWQGAHPHMWHRSDVLSIAGWDIGSHPHDDPPLGGTPIVGGVGSPDH